MLHQKDQGGRVLRPIKALTWRLATYCRLNHEHATIFAIGPKYRHLKSILYRVYTQYGSNIRKLSYVIID